MAKTGPSKKLSLQHIKFVDEFCMCLSATEAARKANYSEKTAGQIGYQLLQNPLIQQAIESRQQELSAKSGVTPEKVIKERAALAHADIRKLFDKDGCPIPPHLIPDDIAPAVSGVDVEERKFTDREGNTTVTTTYKYKTWDKNRALEALDKHFGLYNADESGKFNGVIRVVYEDKPPSEDEE